MASDDLRACIAEALMAWAETNNAPQYASMRRPATVVANANSRADAVMTVVGPELERLHRALDDARSELYQLRTRPAIGAGTPLVCSDERHQSRVTALQAELDKARAELHRHATCAACGHERHRHGYEPIIRRDWCSDCPTVSDLHTFEEKKATDDAL